MKETFTEKVNNGQQKLIPESLDKLARRDLENDDSPALVAYEAAKRLCGPGLDCWETETVAHELLGKHQLTLHDITLNKIWCIMALHQNREVLTSAHVFQKIVLALNGEMPNTSIDEKVEAAHIAWALVALHIELRELNLMLDYGPIKYIAMVLHDEGFVLAPSGMGFVQEELTKLSQAPELVSLVKDAIKKAPEELPDGSLGGILREQVQKLVRVEEYVKIMHAEMTEGLKLYRAG